jgi:hypothetical protein
VGAFCSFYSKPGIQPSSLQSCPFPRCHSGIVGRAPGTALGSGQMDEFSQECHLTWSRTSAQGLSKEASWRDGAGAGGVPRGSGFSPVRAEQEGRDTDLAG